MANFQFCTLQQITDPASVVNVNSSYPETRLAELAKFQRVMRSTNVATDTQVIWDFGSAITIKAITIEQTNVTALKFQMHTADSWGTPDLDTGTLTPTGTDGLDGRRKLFHATGFGVAKQWARLLITGQDAGASYRTLGNCGLWTDLITLTVNVGLPYSRTPDDAADVTKLPGGGREVGYPGPIRVRLQLTSGVFHKDDAAMAEWEALGTLPRHRVVALHENIGDATKFYHVQRTRGFEYQRGDGALEDVRGITMDEV